MTFRQWLNESENNWIPGNPLRDKTGNPIVLYHGTDKNFRKFNIKKSTQGIIWMTSNRDKIVRKEAGASGHGRIISMHVSLQNPAGWKEYEQLLLVQLRSQGYDGAILGDSDGTFDAFVFSPTQIKVIGVEVV